MRPVHPRPHLLAVGLSAALASSAAMAQQIIADGDEQTPAAGEYSTTEPVEPGNPAGHAFLALNGGSIIPTGEVDLRTSGLRAAAVRAENAGSRIELQQGSVSTSGYGAAGLSAADGARVVATGTRIQTHGAASNGAEALDGHLELERVHVTTHAGLSSGVLVQGGTARVTDGVIEVNGSQSNGLVVRGGSLVAERTRIELGDGAYGLVMQNGGDAVLRSVQINGNGGGATGVLAGVGKVVLEDVDINLTHERSGAGLQVGGEVEMKGGSIHARGDNASIVSFAGSGGGKLLLDGVEMSGHHGISLTEGAELMMRNSRLQGTAVGIDINQRDGVVRVEDSSITALNGVGIKMFNVGELDVARSVITADGTYWQAIAMMDGTARINDSRLHTLGQNGHGLYAEGAPGRRPVANASTTEILTEGDGAIGAIARLGGSVHLADSVVRTTGSTSHGVLSGGAGEMSLSNTHVRTEGEGAWAAVINDRGRMRIDGGSLVSAQHGGIWMRSSRDAGLTLTSGAVVSAGNGIGLALDAAVAGRFDLALQGGSQLQGDIVTTPEDEDAGLVPQSDVHMRLVDGSLWQGRSHLLQSLVLEGASQWTLTGDATVGELQVLGSGVALSDGSGRFNTLTVDGNLHSAGGTFLFQGALGGDGSPIDHLHVRGDTSGDAQVSVRNIGGAGAQTVNGIELIRVDGLSDGRFDLAGRAVGGQYEYFLHKGGVGGGAGNWYLRSQLLPPDPCDVDPTLPECGAVVDPPIDPPIDPPVVPPENPIPEPVLRPEGGAYLANLTAAQNLFALGYHRRQAGQNSGRGWVRVDGSRNGFDAVSRRLDIRGNNQSLAVGADLVRNDAGSAFGVMLAGGNASSTSANGLTGYCARGKVKGEALGVYGTWRAAHSDPYVGWYVDGSVQRAQFRNRVEGVALTPERYDSKVWQGAVEAGYALRLGGDARGGLFLEPQLQMGYNRWDSLRHTEANGTVVTTRDADGMFGRAGVRLSGVNRWGNGAAQVQPFIAAHWLHQRSASSVLMDDERVDARIPRSRGEFSGGASVKFAGGVGVWGGLALQRASGYHQTSAQMGVSYSW